MVSCLLIVPVCVVKQSDLLAFFIQSETLIDFQEGFITLFWISPLPLQNPFPSAFLTLLPF